MRMMIAATMAIAKLQMTPAIETQKFATRLLRQRKGLTGVGLAHPINGAFIKKAIAGKRSVPIGSTCASGFNEIRPCNRARSSPKKFEVQACADSWTDKEKISATMKKRNSKMRLLSKSCLRWITRAQIRPKSHKLRAANYTQLHSSPQPSRPLAQRRAPPHSFRPLPVPRSRHQQKFSPPPGGLSAPPPHTDFLRDQTPIPEAAPGRERRP